MVDTFRNQFRMSRPGGKLKMYLVYLQQTRHPHYETIMKIVSHDKETAIRRARLAMRGWRVTNAVSYNKMMGIRR